MLGEWLRRLWYLLNRSRMDAELRAELDAHRAMLGDPVRFGNVTRIREDAHDAWGVRALDDLGRDLRLATRSLWRSPGFTVAVCASLALALTTVTITAVVYAAYLLRPLPYAAGDRLYHVRYAPPGPWEPSALSALDWRALDDVVEATVTAAADTLYLPDDVGYGLPYRLLRVSPGFIEGLGVRADAGRVLVPSDHETPSGAAMISRRLWRERFGMDPSAIGRELRGEVDGSGRSLESFRIVGVLPDGFWFGTDSRDLVDLVTPLSAPARTYRVRLRAGVPVALAEQRIAEAAREVASDIPAEWTGVTLESARERYVAGVRPVLRTAALACGLILAIATANVGVLALLRISRRRKELAVRLTLGASHARIARMLLVEAVLLVVAASSAGLLVAYAALQMSGAAIARQLGRPAPGGDAAMQLGLDVAPVVAGIMVLAVIVTGLLPLVARGARWHRRIADALCRDTRGASDDRLTRRARLGLVAVQIAGSVALLVAGGLTARSLYDMVRTDFGIRTENLVRVSIDFPSSADPDPHAAAARYQRLTDALTSLAGQRVPLFQWPQFAETPKQPVETDGSGAGALDVAVVPVGLGYFEVLHVPLVQGRLFTGMDRLGTSPVAIVSRTAAGRLWPGADPLGRHVLVADRYISGTRTRAWRTVVGVVEDVRQSYGDDDLADVYVPLEQAPPARYAWFYMPLGQSGPSWEPEVRRLAASVDPRASVRLAVPLREEAARQWATPRFMAMLIGMLAVVSVLLTLVGVYGVTAFSLEQRSRDVAIRWALGASGGAMARTLLGEAAAVVAIGVIAGAGGAVAVGRALESHLSGLHSVDVSIVSAGAAVVTAVALAAAALPASRAAGRDHLRRLSEG